MSLSETSSGSPISDRKRPLATCIRADRAFSWAGPCSEHGAEVLEGSPKPHAAVDGGVPAQECLRLCDVGPAALGIILGQVAVDYLALRALDQGDNLKSKLMHGDLGRVSQVHRQGMVDVQQPVDALHQVAHVAEAARLVALAVDGDRLSAECLVEEVGQHPAVV